MLQIEARSPGTAVMEKTVPQLLIAALGALAAAVLAKVIASESRRVNEAMERNRTRQTPTEPPVTRLERDPVTGAYRPRPD